MIKRVLIIGGYGNFGQFISKTLAVEKNIQVIVAGRSLKKAKNLIDSLPCVNRGEFVECDISHGFTSSLSSIKPDIVIHTSGPFQGQGYEIAQACIEMGCHYIDLADGREFVEGIGKLNEQAVDKDVLVISGASSVPCLTSALVDHYSDHFETMEVLEYGITTAQRTARGLATTSAILGYTGKPFTTVIEGKQKKIYGWQGIHIRKFKGLGRRFLGNCDVPDLALFPHRYPDLKTIRFYAGLEIPFIHITLWILSWLVRVGMIRNLQSTAPLLLRISSLFDWLGTANSAFFMKISGKEKDDQQKIVSFNLTAKSGDGPFIPCMPTILLARKLANNKISDRGAFPCVGFISRHEYLNALRGLDISWSEEERNYPSTNSLSE